MVLTLDNLLVDGAAICTKFHSQAVFEKPILSGVDEPRLIAAMYVRKGCSKFSSSQGIMSTPFGQEQGS